MWMYSRGVEQTETGLDRCKCFFYKGQSWVFTSHSTASAGILLHKLDIAEGRRQLLYLLLGDIWDTFKDAKKQR